MTVKELIEKLLEEDPNADVYYDDWEEGETPVREAKREENIHRDFGKATTYIVLHD